MCAVKGGQTQKPLRQVAKAVGPERKAQSAHKSTRHIRGSERITKGEFDDTLTSFNDCRDLWAAKLLAYMHDALQPRRTAQCLPPQVAQAWFGTFDFGQTCRCAGLLPEHVMRAYRARLALSKDGRWSEALHGIVQKGRHKK